MKVYLSKKYSKYIEYMQNLCPRNILENSIYYIFNWKDAA